VGNEGLVSCCYSLNSINSEFLQNVFRFRQVIVSFSLQGFQTVSPRARSKTHDLVSQAFPDYDRYISK